MSKLSLQEVKDIAAATKYNRRGAAEIIVPESQLKYDRIYLARLKTKEVLEKY